MVRFRQSQGVTNEAALDHFHGVMIVLPLLFLLHTRLAWPDSRGLWAMASIPWVTKMSDAGAFFAGRTFGKRKLAPYTEPQKNLGRRRGRHGGGRTVGGRVSVGGPQHLRDGNWQDCTSCWEFAGFGLLLALAGVFGDLAESLLKRDAGLKDSSDWLPGLGGTLDIVDSILWTAPVGYACWMLWLDR